VEETEKVNEIAVYLKSDMGISEKRDVYKQHGKYVLCMQLLLTFGVSTMADTWIECNKEEQ
jgi:hypothetical protein